MTSIVPCLILLPIILLTRGAIIKPDATLLPKEDDPAKWPEERCTQLWKFVHTCFKQVQELKWDALLRLDIEMLDTADDLFKFACTPDASTFSEMCCPLNENETTAETSQGKRSGSEHNAGNEHLEGREIQQDGSGHHLWTGEDHPAKGYSVCEAARKETKQFIADALEFGTEVDRVLGSLSEENEEYDELHLQNNLLE